MVNKIFLIFVLLAIVFVSLPAQTGKVDYSTYWSYNSSVKDGHYWLSLSHEEKASYLEGYMMGSFIIAYTVEKAIGIPMGQFLLSARYIEDVIGMIDSIYEEDETKLNVSIGVIIFDNIINNIERE